MRSAGPLPARRWIAEAIGTFFLVLVGPGTAMVDAVSGGVIGHVGVALAFAFVVIAMIRALGPVSGAHINPAVTLALWSVGRFPASEVAPYLLAQCTGAAAAAGVLRGVLGPVGSAGATVPGIPIPAAFAVEWLLSFALMFVIMAGVDDERTADGGAALPVGLTIGFCALMGGPLTGASMNPARSFGPALVGDVWQAHWIYWLAPVTAMIVAAWSHELVRESRAIVPPAVTPLGMPGPVVEPVERAATS